MMECNLPPESNTRKALEAMKKVMAKQEEAKRAQQQKKVPPQWEKCEKSSRFSLLRRYCKSQLDGGKTWVIHCTLESKSLPAIDLLLSHTITKKERIMESITEACHYQYTKEHPSEKDDVLIRFENIKFLQSELNLDEPTKDGNWFCKIANGAFEFYCRIGKDKMPFVEGNFKAIEIKSFDEGVSLKENNSVIESGIYELILHPYLYYNQS